MIPKGRSVIIMCGICGFCGEITPHLGKNTLKSMLKELIHRGPDDEGIYIDKEAALGMRRLSIIDLKSGHQPIHNEDSSVWMVFNGEIYNYKELRIDLISKGHEFYTNTDSEVIVHLYEEYGEKLADYLVGMFAIAVYDKNLRRLILIRDREGIKPLYYTVKNNTIIFASEIKALLRCRGVEASVNLNALGTYLTYRYVPGNTTMFKDIYTLMPGNLMTFSNGYILVKQYWDVGFNAYYDSEDEDYYTEKLNLIFEKSVRQRLTWDVPIGVFLSGGLDSTIILSEISKLYDSKIKTFSVAFEKPEGCNRREIYDEGEYSRKVSKIYSTEHYECVIKPRDVIDELENIVWFMDEPLGDPTAVPLYFLSKLSSKYVKVVLSGEGADEIFAGYDIYKEPFAVNRYNKIPKFLRRCFIEPMLTAFNVGKGRDFIRRSKISLSERYKGVGMTFRKDEVAALLNQKFSKVATNGFIEEYVTSLFNTCVCKDEVNKMLYFDQKVWLPEDTLMKDDKITMAHSIEMRSPFLDQRLVEFAATIPSSFKYRGNCEKYILKRAFQDKIPDFVAQRKKNGFPVPITYLLNREYRKFASDILLSSKCINRGYFNRSYLEKLLSSNLEKDSYSGRQIWTLLTFEIWNRVFIDDSVNGNVREYSV